MFLFSLWLDQMCDANVFVQCKIGSAEYYTDTIDQIQWIIFMPSKKRELPEQLRNNPETLEFS